MSVPGARELTPSVANRVPSVAMACKSCSNARNSERHRRDIVPWCMLWRSNEDLVAI
jgi:hypothetical protein